MRPAARASILGMVHRVLPLLLLLSACPASEAPFTREVQIVVGEGRDPFAGAGRAELTLRYDDGTELVRTIDPTGEVSIRDLGPGVLSLDLVVYGGGDQILALGRSLPFAFDAEGEGHALFVARADSLVRVPGALSSRRAFGRAALAGNGRVVVVGGGDGADETVSDVDYLNWDPAQPFVGFDGPSVRRIGHDVVAIPEGEGELGGMVVAVGGSFGSGDPIVAGNWWDDAQFGTSVIDPVSGEVRDGPQLAAGYMDGHLVALDDGRFGLLGGFSIESGGDAIYTGEVRLLDLASGVDEAGPSISGSIREQHAVAVVEDLGFELALMTGGVRATSSFQVLDTASLWDRDPSGNVQNFNGADNRLRVARARHTSTPLPRGRALIAGGATGMEDPDELGQALASVEVFDLDEGSFTLSTSTLATARQRHVAVAIPEDRVLICGGVDAAGDPIGSCEVWDDGARSISSFTDSLLPGGPGVEAVPLGDGRVVLIGGLSDLGPDDSVHLYTPPAFTD